MISLLAIFLSCSSSPTSEAPSAPEQPTVAAPQPTPQPSLLLVTMDTTRIDRLGVYGHERAQTPNIDRVAGEGIRFDQAYAVVPLTTPSHASMLSGLYPTRHGIHTNGDATLPDDVVTLAEILSDEGYATAASVSAFVTTRIWNLDQGFQDYFDSVQSDAGDRDQRWSRERRAGPVVDDLEGWLSQKPEGTPFFAWAHFYDPHEPYEPPASHRSGPLADHPYDGEIAYMDEQIGRLIAMAEQAAGEEGLAIVLVADHGESLGEHGEQTHGMYIYESTMRIPFIVRPPKPLQENVVVADAVSNVDVMPTALGLLGKDVPEGLDGQDLSSVAEGASLARGPVYLESETPWVRFGFHPEWAAVEGAWKLFATPNPRLFNVHTDRAEQDNVIATQSAQAQPLDAHVQAVQSQRRDVDNFDASQEVIDQLAALGYVSTNDEGPTDLSDAPDAKDQAALIRRVERLQAMSRNRDKAAEVEAGYREILSELPHLGEARLSLARVLEHQGRLREAEAVLGEGVELQPTSTVLRSNLAANLARQNRFEEAFETSRLIHEQVPGDDLARYAMLRYLRALERTEEALSKGRMWLGLEPGNHGLQALVGELEVLHGDATIGAQLLASSLEDSVPRQGVHRTLAMMAFAHNDLQTAQHHLESEVEWFPLNPALRLELGNLYMKQEAWDDAAAEFDMLRRLVPGDSVPSRLYVQALFSSGDLEAAENAIAPLMESHPDDAEVVLMYANILAASGRLEEGEAVFAEAKALREAQRLALEEELGVPVIEEISDEDLLLPGHE